MVVALVFIASAGSVGCRNNTAQRDAYIRELRMHEDQIYELQDYMTEYQDLLREQRKENVELRKRLEVQQADVDDAAPAAEDTPEQSLLDAPGEEPDDGFQLPDIDPGEPADDPAGIPDVELGEPEPPETFEPEELPEGEFESSMIGPGTGPRQASATVDLADAVRTAAIAPTPQPTQPATSCVLYAEQTPMESGPNSGESQQVGLLAIVEPLTDDGSAGYFKGQVSLMLIDPVAGDDDWEIARWDYTAEEVEAAWRDRSRRVLDLPLAAPATTPLGRPLELWVRMLPAEGEGKILCSTSITLADPVQLVGVPVSGGAGSTVPGATVTSGWTAADEFGDPDPPQTEQRKTWQAATMLPPMEIARAEAAPRPSDKPQPDNARPKPWSPFR